MESYSLFSKGYIKRGIHKQFVEADTDNESDVIVSILYFLQKPVFCFLSFLSMLPIVDSFYEFVSRNWSRGVVGFALRGSYWKRRLGAMGEDCFVDTGVTIMGAKNVFLGNNIHLDERISILCMEGQIVIKDFVHIAANCLLQGKGVIEIGNYCAISAGTMMYSSSNYYLDEHGNKITGSAMAPKWMQRIIKGKISMQDYSFVSVNCAILPNVVIGKHSLVGANSVVNKDVEEYTVVVGSPAKKIKEINR